MRFSKTVIHWGELKRIYKDEEDPVKVIDAIVPVLLELLALP